MKKAKLLCILVISSASCGWCSNDSSNCYQEMFGDDSNALIACKTQFALQSNWFPSPIAGLYSYLAWNGFHGFWQNGLILETYVNFLDYGKHSRYLSVIRNSWRPLSELIKAYGPCPSFDDLCWYGLSYARAYEVLGDKKFLSTSVDIFQWCWGHGWDQSMKCYGGMWFDVLWESKQAITNVLMLHLGAKIYRHTKNKDVFEKTLLIQDFIIKNRFFDKTNYLIKDSIDSKSCQTNNVSYTYTNGVFIGGLVEMYKITENATYLYIANKIAHATISYNSDEKGIFTEVTCEPSCNGDQKVFKGIFVRNLRYLMDITKDKAKRLEYQKWMNFNVKANIDLNMCNKKPATNCNITFKDGPPYYKPSGPVFSATWSGPFTKTEPMQQTSVLDLFVSSISQETKCIGKFCQYDPYYPPAKKMTCDSKPCPSHQMCCEYQPLKSYFCCAAGQTCSFPGVCL